MIDLPYEAEGVHHDKNLFSYSSARKRRGVSNQRIHRPRNGRVGSTLYEQAWISGGTEHYHRTGRKEYIMISIKEGLTVTVTSRKGNKEGMKFQFENVLNIEEIKKSELKKQGDWESKLNGIQLRFRDGSTSTFPINWNVSIS